MQKVVAHWRGPFLRWKVTLPQPARLFKFFEGGLAPSHSRYVTASIFKTINIFDRTFMSENAHTPYLTIVLVLLGLCMSVLAQANSILDLPYANLWSCDQKDKLRPAQKVICDASDPHLTHYNSIVGAMMEYDGAANGNYINLWRDLPMDSPVQKRVIAAQKAYLERRDACGKDYGCILRTEKARTKELYAQQEKLEKAKLACLTQGWETAGGGPLEQRLLDGFNIFPWRMVTLANGWRLQWGTMPDQASIQSVALLDSKGRIQALGTAENLYRSQLGQRLLEPVLRIYVANVKSLVEIVPVLSSWAAASSLGFNQSCDGEERSKCQAALAHLPRMAVYDLHCKARKTTLSCGLPSPAVKGKVEDIGFYSQ